MREANYLGVRIKTPEEVTRKVEGIVRKALDEMFGDEFVFDPVIVNPEIDHYSDEFLHICIVFDGDQKGLKPKLTLSLVGRLFDEMTEDEMPHVPGTSFIAKSEWEEGFEKYVREQA